MRSQFSAQIRFGRVDSVDAEKHTVTVRCEEIDGFIVEGLRMLVQRPGDYVLPAKDTPVAFALIDSRLGSGVILGTFYTEDDPPPLDDAGMRSVAGDDLRLGDPEAEDKVALAPATKDEIQKVLDYANGIATAINAGVATPQDGGAGLKSTIVAALPTLPTLNEPAAEKVKAK